MTSSAHTTLESPPPRKARVFLVDDHPAVRRGLRMLLGLESDLEICGEADGAAEAFSKITGLRPDLAVVDLSLREGSGLELIRRLRKASPLLKILVFSMRNESSWLTRTKLAGADAYVPKDQGADRVVAVIRALLGQKGAAPGGGMGVSPMPKPASSRLDVPPLSSTLGLL